MLGSSLHRRMLGTGSDLLKYLFSCGDEHSVVREHTQAQFAELGGLVSSRQGRAETTLVAREERYTRARKARRWSQAKVKWEMSAVGSSQMQANAIVRRMLRSGSIGVAYRDLEAAERTIERAEIDSLTVRPVTLVPGVPTGNAGPVDRYGLLSTIRRSDVAQWMLDVADGIGASAAT